VAGDGEEVGGELDFCHPRPIPSARMMVTMRRRQGSAHHTSSRRRMAESRMGSGCSCVKHYSFFLLPKSFPVVAICCKYKKKGGQRWVPIRIQREKLGKLPGNRSRPDSRITRSESFTVEISYGAARDFFWACAAHDLEAVREAQKKSP
jgi:hypothetical protein